MYIFVCVEWNRKKDAGKVCQKSTLNLCVTFMYRRFIWLKFDSHVDVQVPSLYSRPRRIEFACATLQKPFLCSRSPSRAAAAATRATILFLDCIAESSGFKSNLPPRKQRFRVLGWEEEEEKKKRLRKNGPWNFEKLFCLVLRFKTACRDGFSSPPFRNALCKPFWRIELQSLARRFISVSPRDSLKVHGR